MKLKILLAIHIMSASLAVASSGTNYRDIKIFDSESNEQVLNSSKGKLLVVLWATWCPDCKAKLKGDLKNLASNPKIDILALNTEKNIKRVQEFIKEESITLPIAYDKQNSFRKELELFTVPAWAVFNQKSDGSLELVDKGSPFDTKQINTALGQSVFK